MTAGARHGDETGNGGGSREGHLRQEETTEPRTSGTNRFGNQPIPLVIKSKPSCDTNVETCPMFPSNSVSEIPTRGGGVRNHCPYQANKACGSPSTHAAPSTRASCDDQSILSSSNSLKHPYCSARTVNSHWMSFRGSSVPPGIEDCPPSASYASSATPKVSGCSVLLDKSIDLIELTADDDALPGTECPDKRLKKWRFSRNKCKSLDGADKYQSNAPSPRSPIRYNSDDFEVPRCTGVTRGSIDRDTNPIAGTTRYEELKNDEEFRSRSLSLTPTVNLAIFETESYSSDEDNIGLNGNDLDNVFSTLNRLDNSQLGAQTISAPLLNRTTIHCSPSAAQLSLASSMTDSGAPICKICHTTSKDGDPLISPCRCAGTMQYIHCGCLMHWLEISSKKSRKPPSCELCQYQYHWHKKFKVRHWQFPHCSRRDKVLHVLFLISVMIMIGCATITIMCFKQDKGTKIDPDRTELTDSEIVTLVCGVLFFLAFFVAMYVEVKARNTIYKLLVRFVYLNQQWYIDEYEKKDSAPVSV